MLDALISNSAKDKVTCSIGCEHSLNEQDATLDSNFMDTNTNSSENLNDFKVSMSSFQARTKCVSTGTQTDHLLTSPTCISCISVGTQTEFEEPTTLDESVNGTSSQSLNAIEMFFKPVVLIPTPAKQLGSAATTSSFPIINIYYIC